MKRWLLVFCAFLCAGSFVSCGVQRYRVDSASRVVDTAGTFRNDRLGLSFYFSKFYTQHGELPAGSGGGPYAGCLRDRPENRYGSVRRRDDVLRSSLFASVLPE